MKYLFLLTIPNVQAFIKQARKTQDLYVGSQLLSDLVKIGAYEFISRGGNLIFPNKNAVTFTNRFLGEVIGEKTQEELQKIGEATATKINDHLKDIAKKSVQKVIVNDDLPTGFDDQIEQLLDIKWAFIEWNEAETNYKEAYSELEKVIGAIKNVRTFKQFDYQGRKGERGRKCNIDGERNVKFYKLAEKEQDNTVLRKKLFIDNKKEVCFVRNTELKYLNEGEGLSAVSFFKRCYIPEKEKNNKDFNFPSTAEIALKELENQNPDEFNKYKKLFNKNEFATLLINHFDKKDIHDYEKDFNKYFDYQYFYPENLTDKEISNANQLKLVKKWHDKFIKPIVGSSKNRYYAVLVFDGDSMGEWLSRVNLLDKNKLYEFHEELSSCLSNFSKKVETILDVKRGKAVYSGGDDFMGFVNLNHLFDVMKEIYELFEKLVNEELFKNDKFKIKENRKLTLSAGIAIAHYKTPLSIVLEKAREMENLAKQDDTNGYKKDAFAIAALKRSGEINQTVWKWKQGNEFTTEILKNLVSELQNESGISNTFIKNAQIEFSMLCNEKGQITVDNKLFNKEFERLLNKSGGNNDVFNKLKAILPQEKQENYNLQNFFMALNIADFIQRNTN